MKKVMVTISSITIILIISLMFFSKNSVYATEVIDEESESRIIQIKEEQIKTLDEYKEKYGSDAYGLTAYILHVVQVYSIPLCFMAIAISAIYRFIIGTRHMENLEKGTAMIVGFVTLTIICQVLPLVFAVVIKIGKE